MTDAFLKHAMRIHAALESHGWLSKVLKMHRSFKIQPDIHEFSIDTRSWILPIEGDTKNSNVYFPLHVNVTACVPAYVHVKVHASAWFLDKYPKSSILMFRSS